MFNLFQYHNSYRMAPQQSFYAQINTCLAYLYDNVLVMDDEQNEDRDIKSYQNFSNLFMINWRLNGKCCVKHINWFDSII